MSDPPKCEMSSGVEVLSDHEIIEDFEQEMRDYDPYFSNLSSLSNSTYRGYTQFETSSDSDEGHEPIDDNIDGVVLDTALREMKDEYTRKPQQVTRISSGTSKKAHTASPSGDKSNQALMMPKKTRSRIRLRRTIQSRQIVRRNDCTDAIKELRRAIAKLSLVVEANLKTPRNQRSYDPYIFIFMILTCVVLAVMPEIYEEASSLLSRSSQSEPPSYAQLIYSQINQTKSVFRLSLGNIQSDEECFEKQSLTISGIKWEISLCQQPVLQDAYTPQIYVEVAARQLTGESRVIGFSFWVYDLHAQKSRLHSTEKACIREEEAGPFTRIGDILRFNQKCSTVFKQTIEDKAYLSKSDLRHGDNSIVVSIDVLN